MPEEITPGPEEAIESAIVAQVKSALDVPVENVPDKPWKFTHPKGSVLVGFVDGKANGVLDTFTSTQQITLRYEVLMLARSLRSHTGLYRYWTDVRKALLGWEPPGSTPLTLDALRNLGYDDGAWRMSATFTTSILLVPDIEPASGPPLKEMELYLCNAIRSDL